MDADPAGAILHRLLDSYERRADPAERAVSLGPESLPGYRDDHDPGVRLAVNARLAQWEAAGWVRLRWVRGERGNLLERVSLRPEALEAIYDYLERVPRADQEAILAGRLAHTGALVSPVLTAVLDAIRDALHAGRPVAPFRLDEPERNEDLLAAVRALDRLAGEITEREFSARVLGDSKRLAGLKPALRSLLERAQPELADVPEEAFWPAIGLRLNPGHVYLHGPLVVRVGGATLDVGAFTPDLGLPVAAIEHLEIVSLAARYLLTVENQTSFYDYVAAAPGAGLVVYLGGFPNRARRELLRRLLAARPDLPVYHWGDLDYGGLAILAHLRRVLPVPVQPHQMDPATLATYQAAGRPLSATDRRHLARLRADPDLRDLAPLIDALLAAGVKIEQEVVAPRPL